MNARREPPEVTAHKRGYSHAEAPPVKPLAMSAARLGLPKIYAFQRDCLGQLPVLEVSQRHSVSVHDVDAQRASFQAGLPTDRAIAELLERSPWTAGSVDVTSKDSIKMHNSLRNRLLRTALAQGSCLVDLPPWLHAAGMTLEHAHSHIALLKPDVRPSEWRAVLQRYPHSHPLDAVKTLVQGSLGHGFKKSNISVRTGAADGARILVQLANTTYAPNGSASQLLAIAVITAFQVRSAYARWFSVPLPNMHGPSRAS